jgi:hypothetical protein
MSGMMDQCSCKMQSTIGRAAGPVDGILALRDNAFQAELAGMDKDSRAVTLEWKADRDGRSAVVLSGSSTPHPLGAPVGSGWKCRPKVAAEGGPGRSPTATATADPTQEGRSQPKKEDE